LDPGFRRGDDRVRSARMNNPRPLPLILMLIAVLVVIGYLWGWF
jgi:hypothetical protein